MENNKSVPKPSGMPNPFGRPNNFAKGRFKGVVKPKDLNGTLKRLFKYFRSQYLMIFFLLVIILIHTAITLIVPLLIGKSIDAIVQKNGVDFIKLKFAIGILLSLYIVDSISNLVQGFLMADISQKMVKELRQRLFEKLQKLPITFFDTHSFGDIMSRLSNDVDNVSSTVYQSAIQLISGIIIIIGSLFMMLYLNFILTLASMVTIPLVYLLTHTIAKKTKPLFKAQQSELGKLNGHIEESITGISIIKSFNYENKVIEQFQEINDRLCTVSTKAQICSGYIMPIMNVINNIGFTMVAGVGGILAVKGVITIGVIASFINYSKQFSRPLNDLASIFNTLQSAVSSAERVFEVMDEADEVDEMNKADKINKTREMNKTSKTEEMNKMDNNTQITEMNSKEDIKGNVEFDHVGFYYREDVMVLEDISFNVKQGQSVALVGPTGAGKTTIVNLLARFYDVTSGSIKLDGTNIRAYKRNDLRQCFGIVLQDTYLFSGTIKENIRYGKLDATDDEVYEACKMASADAYIRRLPQGYETLLTESGSNLSQGQRQLLAIARAILKDPAILILDEATSSVDTRTELRIQKAMLKLMEGRTSFIIAHRLSTIRDADTIMVIDGGKIVEKGNHESLLKQKGRYYEMASMVNGEDVL